VISYILGLLFTSAVIFAGMLLLHDFLVDTNIEITLRKENSAIEKHRILLEDQLTSVNAKLDDLHRKDQNLHNKFFSSVTGSPTHARQRDDSKRNILLADGDAFSSIADDLEEKSEALIEQSRISSSDFSESAVLSEKLDSIAYIPFHQPVAGLTPDKLLSGFGKRINPFHKGIYDHTGVDIALPRGTEILATANGRVSNIKRSALQAGYGNYIDIDHGNGFVTRFAHLDDIRVKQGQKIEQGMSIATSGSSGGSAAPHLHYEIMRNGKNVDPILFMLSGVSTEVYEQFSAVSLKENQSLD
jgi:murein DD-endopeptidase MepM/ murein hydrolase activator NlpD